jgi:hypothetical protein
MLKRLGGLLLGTEIGGHCTVGMSIGRLGV